MKRKAFTLIELLTVIAIIAVLAAIMFPVFARARDSAHRASDLSALNEIRSALQLYRVDQGGFPPALLGYVTPYQTGAGGGNVVPASQIAGFLYPNRVDSIETFRPRLNRASLTAWTTAVWPNADPRPPGTAPQVDLNGDGRIDSADDPAGARQLFGLGTGPPTVVLQNPAAPPSAANLPLQFYRMSGYEVAEVPNVGGGTRWELRYALFWSDWGIHGGAANDDPRQLGYADPPETTVVTWNSHFRDYQNGVPERTRRDQVLFLGGGARPYDSREVHERSWRLIER
jgi:prepilin-type N-terminal cleavage/methylation domain-containing protein